MVRASPNGDLCVPLASESLGLGFEPQIVLNNVQGITKDAFAGRGMCEGLLCCSS